jgi:hypothetical protein
MDNHTFIGILPPSWRAYATVLFQSETTSSSPSRKRPGAINLGYSSAVRSNAIELGLDVANQGATSEVNGQSVGSAVSVHVHKQTLF